MQEQAVRSAGGFAVGSAARNLVAVSGVRPGSRAGLEQLEILSPTGSVSSAGCVHCFWGPTHSRVAQFVPPIGYDVKRVHRRAVGRAPAGAGGLSFSGARRDTRAVKRPRIDSFDYDPHCRGCSVPLMQGNARTSRGRFVGVCRPCESEESRARSIAAGRMTGRSRRTDSVRKYPVPTE